MPETEAERSRRRRRHAKGDHHLCKPGRCPDAAEAEVVVIGGEAEGPDVATSALVEAYRSRLTEVERVNTPEGQHVLRLAEALSKMSDSASGLASLSRALQAAMDRAMDGAKAPGVSWVDEVARKRAERLGGGA